MNSKVYFLFLTLAFPVQVSANPPLLSVPELMTPLIEARAADVVRKGCPSYTANIIRAYQEAKALEVKAIKMGYKKSEVRAFIKNPEAKSYVKGKANVLLASLGAKGDSASLCAAGDRLVARGGIASRLISR